MRPPKTPSAARAGARSQALMDRARAVIPGGVNSPVRAFGSVGQRPPFIRRAFGAYLETEDGAVAVDYVGTWGPAILGHAHPEVVAAVQEAAARGLSFGACCAAEAELAELLCERVPALAGGLVRMVNSGTEATMSALRLARGATGRDKIIKMDGGYHGHADTLLVAAGSGAATLGLPGSAGVTAAAVADTLIVPFNDARAVEEALDRHADQVAAVIVEPVAGNMGCVPPREGYLARLRELTAAHGALLVFDEVMTGFRVGPGGAGARYGVTPDLVCLGKIVGGGLPVGAYGGRRELMEQVAPLGPVYQAGTLSGNPLAMAAGLATLRALAAPGLYDALEARTAALCEGLAARARARGVPAHVQRAGSMFTLFFQDGPVHDYADAGRSDRERFARWHQEMLARGVYLPPSQFEACFISTAHDDAAIEHTLAAADAALAAVAEG